MAGESDAERARGAIADALRNFGDATFFAQQQFLCHGHARAGGLANIRATTLSGTSAARRERSLPALTWTFVPLVPSGKVYGATSTDEAKSPPGSRLGVTPQCTRRNTLGCNRHKGDCEHK
jgi:hypothetical protein